MKIDIILENGGIMPAKATEGAAAYDVYAPEDFFVRTGRQVMPLNFRIAVPYGYEAHLQSRSGFSAKGMEGKSVLDLDGTLRFDCDVLEGKIDSDYRGVVGLILHCHDIPFWITQGTRVAQMTIRKVEDAEFNEVKELKETERGEGGFGHTNKK